MKLQGSNSTLCTGQGGVRFALPPPTRHHSTPTLPRTQPQPALSTRLHAQTYRQDVQSSSSLQAAPSIGVGSYNPDYVNLVQMTGQAITDVATETDESGVSFAYFNLRIDTTPPSLTSNRPAREQNFGREASKPQFDEYQINFDVALANKVAAIVHTGQAVHVQGELSISQSVRDDGTKEDYLVVDAVQIWAVGNWETQVLHGPAGAQPLRGPPDVGGRPAPAPAMRRPSPDAGGMRPPQELWREFVDNPNAFWDNRKDKRNPRAPDFKHKDTGEALWLTSPDGSSNLPSWVTEGLKRSGILE